MHFDVEKTTPKLSSEMEAVSVTDTSGWNYGSKIASKIMSAQPLQRILNSSISNINAM